MSDQNPDQLSLREQIGQAEAIVRELQEHLSQSFLPKVKSARESIFPTEGEANAEEIPDSTVRNLMADILRSDEFTLTMLKRLEPYLRSIQRGVREILEEG
ncbi:MAG: hypothetical protein ACKOGA_06290 [Planctomycetaceae bacterium]